MRALFSLVAVFFLLPIVTLSATQQLLETEDGKHYLLQTSIRKKGPSTSLPQTRSRSDDYFDLRRWVRRGNQKVRYDKNMSLHCQGSLGVHGMACTRCVHCAITNELQFTTNTILHIVRGSQDQYAGRCCAGKCVDIRDWIR